jgi:hypothetical protein
MFGNVRIQLGDPGVAGTTDPKKDQRKSTILYGSHWARGSCKAQAT